MNLIIMLGNGWRIMWWDFFLLLKKIHQTLFWNGHITCHPCQDRWNVLILHNLSGTGYHQSHLPTVHLTLQKNWTTRYSIQQPWGVSRELHSMKTKSVPKVTRHTIPSMLHTWSEKKLEIRKKFIAMGVKRRWKDREKVQLKSET